MAGSNANENPLYFKSKKWITLDLLAIIITFIIAHVVVHGSPHWFQIYFLFLFVIYLITKKSFKSVKLSLIQILVLVKILAPVLYLGALGSKQVVFDVTEHFNHPPSQQEMNELFNSTIAVLKQQPAINFVLDNNPGRIIVLKRHMQEDWRNSGYKVLDNAPITKAYINGLIMGYDNAANVDTPVDTDAGSSMPLSNEDLNRLADIVQSQPYPGFAGVYQSAQSGMPEGEAMLATYYLKGINTPKNIDKAIYWFTKSAKQGDVTSQMTLGQIYLDGIEVKKDIPEAVNWFQKAADAGNKDAQAKIDGIFQH